MEQRESMYSHETYWEDFHGEKLPAPEEKEATVYKYNKEALYWLDYYEDKIGFALSEVEMQLKHAKERKKEMDFEWKLFGGIFLGMFLLLPIALALPMTGVVFLVIFGAILVIIEIWAIAVVGPICLYKVIKCLVSKAINDINNPLGQFLVQKYHVPRLSGEIQACQIHIGRYKESLANLASWRDMVENGSFDMEISELKNRMEKVNLDPKIETASVSSYRLKRLINRTTIAIAVLFFLIIFVLITKGYLAYYHWWLSVWESV